ncbi:MAG: aminotransferase class III-fold pyridoxal phosphate-dependent enzyme [Bdellovibrionota bacterium]
MKLFIGLLFICVTLSHTSAEANSQCASLFEEEIVDFSSEWGVNFLSYSDPAWTEPGYLKELAKYAAPTITNYGGRAELLLSKFDKVFNDFSDGFIARFTISGTDANNYLFDYAAQSYHSRTRKEPIDVKLLSFEDPYAGAYGKIYDLKYGSSQLTIPTPRLHPNRKYSKAELAEIKKIELRALKFIREKVKNPDLEIGGIFIEPIPVSHGIYMYRPEFMRQLRKLADELKVPIFADEILTGGGRTGKFWAYEHYEGFVPDLVTFGKGLVVAGIFVPTRKSSSLEINPWDIGSTTTSANPLSLVQAIQVLETIKKRNLIDNARDVGEYFYERLKQRHLESKIYKTDDLDVRGVGLLLWYSSYRRNFKIDSYKEGYGPRMLPPLTLTRQQVDDLFIESSKNDGNSL